MRLKWCMFFSLMRKLHFQIRSAQLLSHRRARDNQQIDDLASRAADPARLGIEPSLTVTRVTLPPRYPKAKLPNARSGDSCQPDKRLLMAISEINSQ